MGLPDARYLKPRFQLALALSLPVFILAMGEMIPGWPAVLSGKLSGWLQFLLSTPVFFWCGKPFLRRWWTSIRERDTNMFTIIVTGTGAAYFYSTAALIWGEHWGAVSHAGRGASLYFEACAVTTTIVLLGQILEQAAHAKTDAAIRALMELRPPLAHRVTGGIEADVPVGEVQVEDVLRVRPGEKVPVDGVLLEGTCEIDESMLTGEPLPQLKQAGDAISAGNLNTQGSFLFRATRVGSDTLLAQIVRLVEEAQETEAPIQGVADKAAAWFVPVVASVALLAFVIWGFWGPEPRWIHALVSAVAVLVISCPCTLGLATPVALVTGIGRGAKAGILVRKAEALETLAKARVLLIDKTGTLTQGSPKVHAVHPSAGLDENNVLQLAASIESPSEHPLARAIVAAARERRLSIPSCEAFRSEPGVGVEARVGERHLRLLRCSDENTKDSASKTPATRVQLEENGRVLGTIDLVDALRQDSVEAVRELHALGFKLVVVSGDRQETVAWVSEQLGIDAYHAQCSPADKQEIVRRHAADGIVVFAGDGINDAPALAAASVGIALGSGSGIAIDSAGLVLMKADISTLAAAARLSRATLATIRQNLFWAFFYNGLGIPVAAGLFYPLFGWQLNPMLAGFAMSMSSLCVVSNSMRLRNASLHRKS